MELVKNNWKKEDILNFQKYLKTFEDSKKKDWATNILQTELPVLCMKSIDIKTIVSEIYKGNYLNFLDYMVSDYYENTAINGYLISKIKDFDIMKNYLDRYSLIADNWATCDLLKFNIKKNEQQYFDLACNYTNSTKTFVKRIGILILFDFINNNEYNDKIFSIVDKFKTETEYYVNMINAWLLCEMFIKQREKTLVYLNSNNNLNKFTMNKFISKCRDSRRISIEDKDMLIKFRVK